MSKFLEWETEKAEAAFAAVIENWKKVVAGKQEVGGRYCEFCLTMECSQCFLATNDAGLYVPHKSSCRGTPYVAFTSHYSPRTHTCTTIPENAIMVCCVESRELAWAMLVFLIEERIRYRDLKKERVCRQESLPAGGQMTEQPEGGKDA